MKGRKLGRTASHRTATLRSLATALIKHKKITTTLAKAKQTRLFVEPIITKAKNDTVHARRLIAKDIQDKDTLKELFAEVVPKIGDRPGGYTRVVKLGNRVGDAAEMAIIELVDYNDLAEKKASKSKKQTKAKTAKAAAAKVADVAEEVKDVVEESSNADDLSKVEGIGPKISELLQNAGITTFAQLAETEVEKLNEILAEAGGRYKSHDPSTWPQQAKLAADGKWDELKALQDELDGGREKK
ncbi:MAG: 50S ribosomal protein L17 [Ignavibacteriae bacterium]|nr:50S ribosomal protein L17 [Ignavibacteriota bacterium]MCB9259394.1 50S ribosomal protein L17 [Ignavibacteriales bacterium]